MIYKFKSKAAGDVIMLGPHGDRVLGVIGKAPSRQGIIEPVAMPSAIVALEAAMAADDAVRAETSRARRDGDLADPVHDAVSLRQRAWPLVEMMQRCQRADAPIVWGV